MIFHRSYMMFNRDVYNKVNLTASIQTIQVA